MMLRRETSSSGFESWRKLNKRYHIPSKASAVGKLPRILEPPIKKGSFEDTLASWEDEISKYEKGIVETDR